MFRIVYKNLGINVRWDVRWATVAIVALGLGGCAKLNNWMSADITSAASSGLGAVIGTRDAEELNQEIVLRARSPLVIPPEYNLRPPVNASEEQQQLGTAWPDDPDVKAKELAALEKARSDAEFDKYSRKPEGRSTPLTPEELAAGMVMSKDVPTGPTGRLERVDNDSALPPDELLRRHRLKKQAAQQASSGPQLLNTQQASLDPQANTKQAAEGTQYQTQDVVAPPAPAPPPEKKKEGLLDRLVFWD